tara:strand:- start:1323 stop:1553 length:231 start_codon:yes stop_codon:yes gene_type:complete
VWGILKDYARTTRTSKEMTNKIQYLKDVQKATEAYYLSLNSILNLSPSLRLDRSTKTNKLLLEINSLEKQIKETDQ